MLTKYRLSFFLSVWYLFLNCISPTYASTIHDFQTWPTLLIMGNFRQHSDTSLKYWLEGQERLGNDSSQVSQSIVRGGLGFPIDPETSIWLGYARIYTGPPYAQHPFKEDRIWEQFLWVKSTAKLTFTSRTRMEQRFLETAHKIAYRARQLFKVSVPFKTYTRFAFVSSDELFWHKNDFVGRNGEGFDQNRFFIGLGYKFNDNFNTEMGYLNQYVRRFGVPNFLANVLSLNFYLNL